MMGPPVVLVDLFKPWNHLYSNNKLVVEVMNASNAWVDVTADVQHISVRGVGLSAARSNHAGIGRCDIVLRNTSRTYNPDITGVASARIGTGMVSRHSMRCG